MYYHRLFKWSEGYHYLTHEPPTVIDEHQIDLRKKHWFKGRKMKRKGIYMYHYSLLFPWQVEQKVRVYQDEKPDLYSDIIEWADNNYFKLSNPFRVHNLYRHPSWLARFHGKQPEQVICMMKDIKQGHVNAKLRRTDDIEAIIDSPKYKFKIILLKIQDPSTRVISQLKRIKNIPNRIRKIRQKLMLL
jgi:hypothetical protein